MSILLNAMIISAITSSTIKRKKYYQREITTNDESDDLEKLEDTKRFIEQSIDDLISNLFEKLKESNELKNSILQIDDIHSILTEYVMILTSQTLNEASTLINNQLIFDDIIDAFVNHAQVKLLTLDNKDKLKLYGVEETIETIFKNGLINQFIEFDDRSIIENNLKSIVKTDILSLIDIEYFKRQILLDIFSSEAFEIRILQLLEKYKDF